MDRSWYALPAGVLAGVAILLGAPVPRGAATMLAITAFCIALWIGNPVPPWFVGLVGIGLIGLAFSPDLALVGFRTPALWLIVFGLVVGEATRHSGLAALVEERLLGRLRAGATDDARRLYRRLLVSLCAGALAFALLVPSALVRVLVLAPIAAELGRPFESARAHVGIFLGPLVVTWHAAGGILTGALPNIVAVGILESVVGRSVSWSSWLVALFPLTSLARAALVVAVVYYLYRPEPGDGVDLPAATETSEVTGATEAPGATGAAGRSVTGTERRMLVFLLVGVAVWATDFLHGLHPMFGALLVAVLSLSPRVGVIEFDAVREVNFPLVFFVGAVFAIARGLQRTGFTETATNALLAGLPADLPLALTMGAVFVATSVLMLLVEGVALASVLTPVMITYAEQTGAPLLPIVFAEVLALDTSYFFPYQSMVLVTILGYGVVDARELIRTTVAVSLLAIVLLVPLQILYLLVLY